MNVGRPTNLVVKTRERVAALKDREAVLASAHAETEAAAAKAAKALERYMLSDAVLDAEFSDRSEQLRAESMGAKAQAEKLAGQHAEMSAIRAQQEQNLRIYEKSAQNELTLKKDKRRIALWAELSQHVHKVAKIRDEIFNVSEEVGRALPGFETNPMFLLGALQINTTLANELYKASPEEMIRGGRPPLPGAEAWKIRARRLAPGLSLQAALPSAAELATEAHEALANVLRGRLLANGLPGPAVDLPPEEDDPEDVDDAAPHGVADELAELMIGSPDNSRSTAMKSDTPAPVRPPQPSPRHFWDGQAWVLSTVGVGRASDAELKALGWTAEELEELAAKRAAKEQRP
jgi:hypothetical protein